MALADAMLASTRSQVEDTERTVTDLAAALNAVKADKAKLFAIITMFEGVNASADDVTKAAIEAAKAILGVRMAPGQAATTVAGIEAEAKALRDLRDASVEARLAETKVADIDWGNAIRATRLLNMQMDQVAESVVRVRGAIPLGTSQRVFEMPTAAMTPSGIPNEDLRRMAIFEEHAATLQRESAAALTGSAAALTGSAAALDAAATRGGGGRGPGFGSGLLAGMGFGGGRGIYLPPPFGFGFRGMRAFGGMAALGSLGGLMGFGAERALATTAGIAGSLGGGLLGGGLLGAGILGTTAVGMGTDLAGIGQAAGDIKDVTKNLDALNTAIETYGPNSTQAANAQLALNQALGGFSPVARNAVLAASQTSLAFKSMFDKATGQAEKTGAEILNQAMHVGMKFLPTIGRFAAQNMRIIQHGIQPFFSWLQQKGPQGGLGIFTNLEKIFQARLPTTVHALTQAAELFAKVIDVAAQHTGGLMRHLDAFFTKWNSPSNFGQVRSTVGSLIGLFRTWMGLFGSIIHLTFALFKPAVGLGQQFAQTLTDIVNQVRAWVSATGTQNVLHSLFGAHLQQVKLLGQLIQSLLPLLLSVVSAFLQIEAAFASAFNNGLRPIIDAVKWLLSQPLVDKILGWAGALWLVVRAAAALKVAFALMFSSNFLAGLKAIPLAFLGIQTAEVRAAVATAVETKAVQAQTIAMGEQLALLPEEVAVRGGLLGLIGRSSIGAGAIAGGGRLLGALGPAALYAGGGFLLGGLAKSAIPGRAGQIAGGGIMGAGAGAGLGTLYGSLFAPETAGLSIAVGAAIGAVAGALLSLRRTAPSVSQELKTLGHNMFVLQRESAAGANTTRKQSQTLARIGVQFLRSAREAGIFFNATTKGFAGSAAGMGTLEKYAGRGAQANKDYQASMMALARTLLQQDEPRLAAVARDLANINALTHKPVPTKVIHLLLKAEMTGSAEAVKLLARLYGIGPGGGPAGPTGPRSVYNPVPLNLKLPRAIALEIAKANAGHGSIEKADAAAYAYYENMLKQHNLTRKQILAIYQAEAAYAPYQTPGSYTHATGTTAAQRAAAAAAAKAHALAAQAKINKVLGIGGGVGVSQALTIGQQESRIFIHALEQLLGGAHHNIATTARALGVTPGQLSRESPAELLRQMRRHGITLDTKSLAELRKIQEAIRIAHAENVKMTPAETRKITNWLQQIQQELNGTNTMASNYIAPSARALTAGLGLTPKQRAEEIARLSSYYMHGKHVPTGGAAGGVPLPAGVGGGVQLPVHHHHHHRHGRGGRLMGDGGSTMTVGTVVIHVSGAEKDGAALAREMRSELLRIQRRNGAQTRGPNAGRGVGLG